LQFAWEESALEKDYIFPHNLDLKQVDIG
jgi:hypothetical protein